MLGSLSEIVENTLGEGQGANGLLASMSWDGLSNPTISSETLVSRLGLFHEENVTAVGKGLASVR